MARNVFRITPRATQIMRAIEDHLQQRLDDAVANFGAPRTLVVFNSGDFKFREEVDNLVTVTVYHVEVMHTLAHDRKFFLSDYHYSGLVRMRKHTASNGFVHYTTESVELRELDTTKRDERDAHRASRDLYPSLNDTPLRM